MFCHGLLNIIFNITLNSVSILSLYPSFLWTSLRGRFRAMNHIWMDRNVVTREGGQNTKLFAKILQITAGRHDVLERRCMDVVTTLQQRRVPTLGTVLMHIFQSRTAKKLDNGDGERLCNLNALMKNLSSSLSTESFLEFLKIK